MKTESGLVAVNRLYAEREYEEGAIEPKDLPAPILTHALRQQVVDAIRYAVRASTNCGKEDDFDPDAMVQNAVYALCGSYIAAAPIPPTWPDGTPRAFDNYEQDKRFAEESPPVSEDRKDAEQMQVDFNAAIHHAISLGHEAAYFLRCWNEGDWDACAQFDFTPSETLRNPYTTMQEDKP